MSVPLEDDVVQRVNDLGPSTWSGTTYRYTTTGRDPRSGEGARRFGGRWNPRDTFPVNYLAQPVATCMGELERTAAAAGTQASSRIRAGLSLHTLQATALEVLDLTEPSALNHVGLDAEDLTDEDWTACQAVGHAAHFLGYDGVLAPSATGTGLVIAAFEARLGQGQLEVVTSEVLTDAVYHRLR